MDSKKPAVQANVLDLGEQKPPDGRVTYWLINSFQFVSSARFKVRHISEEKFAGVYDVGHLDIAAQIMNRA